MTWEEFKNYLTDNFTYKRTAGISTGQPLDIMLQHEFYNNAPTGKVCIWWRESIGLYEDGRVKIANKMFFNRTPAQMYQIILALTEKGE